MLEALADSVGVALSFSPASRPFLHPGKAAQVSLESGALIEDGSKAGTIEIGWIGELHPRVADRWDLAETVGFELNLSPLVAAARSGEEVFEDVTSFPAVLQDLAVVVPEETSAEQVVTTVREAGGGLLRRADVFDLYRGGQLGAEHKSLALRLEFRATDRTLTEDETKKLRARIEAAIEGIGGSIRE